MANGANEISAELRLNTAQAISDFKKALAQMKSSLSLGMGQDIGKAVTATDKLTASAKKTKTAVKEVSDELKKWRESIPAPVVRDTSGATNATRKKYGPGAIVPLTGGGLATAPAGQDPLQAALAQGYKRYTGIIRNPLLQSFQAVQTAPPKIPTASAASASSFSKQGLSAMSASGIPYISTLARAAFSPLGAALGVVALEVLALRKLFNELGHSVELARANYARQLTSGGLPGSFVAKRSALASIIGVSEQEVFQFGKQIEYLNEKLAMSVGVTTATTRSLTAVSWEFAVFGKNCQAVWDIIAAQLAPAMLGLGRALNATLEIVISWGVKFGEVLKTVLRAAIVTALGQTAGLAYDALAASGENAKPIPGVEASSSRLPASAWEKMGLILGPTVAQAAAQRTAQNTAQIVEQLNTLNHTIVNLRNPDGAMPFGNGNHQ